MSTTPANCATPDEIAAAMERRACSERGVNMPLRFWRTEFSPGYHPAFGDIAERARQWIRDFSPGSRGLFLTGPVGCGKTQLACHIAKRLMARGFRDLQYWNISHLLSEIRSCWDSAKSEADLLGELADQDLLIIDDLGAESIGQSKSETAPWIIERLYLIVDRAYNSNQTLIVTSNKRIGVLGPSYGLGMGPRLVSRIADLTETWSDFPQADMRRRTCEGGA